jgi:hypothetical protein
MKTLLMIALLVVSTAAPTFARGRSYAGGNVVHSRRAPVIMHRAIPGGGGVHVYHGGGR